MKIRVFTNIWNVDKMLYRIMDWDLPRPVSFTTLMWFTGCFFFMMINPIPLPFINDNFVVKYILLPVGLSWFFSKKGFVDKKPYNFVVSVFKYLIRGTITNKGKKVNTTKGKIKSRITIERSSFNEIEY